MTRITAIAISLFALFFTTFVSLYEGSEQLVYGEKSLPAQTLFLLEESVKSGSVFPYGIIASLIALLLALSIGQSRKVIVLIAKVTLAALLVTAFLNKPVEPATLYIQLFLGAASLAALTLLFIKKQPAKA